MKGRVQVNDLAAPEAIQPFGVQSSTFAAPAQAPIDNSWEQLEKGLSAFANGAYALDRSMEKDYEEELKAHEASVKDKVAAFRLAATTDEIDNAWQSGKFPYQADMVKYPWLMKMWARDESEAFGRELDNDPELKNRLGDATFDLDKYVREKARPRIERMQGEEGALAEFGAGVERQYERVSEDHRKWMGVANTAATENAAMGELDRTFDAAIKAGHAPDQYFTDDYRQIYASLGPRLKGGAANIRRGRLDELTLDMLKKKAEDPSKVQYALSMLDSERFGDDGKSLGRLRDVEAHKERVDAIETIATKTLAKEEERVVKERILAADVTAFDDERGDHSMLGDYDKPGRYNPAIKVTEAERKKASAIAWVTAERQRTGTVNVRTETSKFATNAVEHPEFFDKLKQGYIGGANVVLKPGEAPPPEAVQQVVAAASLYADMKAVAPNYVAQTAFLPEKAQDFYETVLAGMRLQGLSNRQAVQQAITIQAQNAQNPDRAKFSVEQVDTIKSGLKKIGAGVLWGSGINNAGQLYPAAERLAKINVMIGGMSEKDAIVDALDQVTKRAVVVNGRGLAGVPGIEEGQKDAIHKIIGSYWQTENKALRALGIESEDQISVGDVGGALQLIDATSGRPLHNEKQEPLQFSTGSVLRVNSKLIAMERARQLRVAENYRKGVSGYKPSEGQSKHNAAVEKLAKTRKRK